MRLSRTVFEMLSLIFQKFGIRWLGHAMINMHTKFEVSSLSHSRDILGD